MNYKTMEPETNSIDEILGTPEEVAVPVEVTPEPVEVLSPTEPTQEPVQETVVVDSTNVQEIQEVVPEVANNEPQSVSEAVIEETKEPLDNGNKLEMRNPDGTLKKGAVLNPNGRPKGARSMTTILREYLMNTTRKTADGDEVTIAEGVMRKLADNALRGKERSIEMLLERIDGKVDSNINFKGYLGVDTTIPESDKEALRVLLYGTDTGNNQGEETKS